MMMQKEQRKSQLMLGMNGSTPEPSLAKILFFSSHKHKILLYIGYYGPGLQKWVT